MAASKTKVLVCGNISFGSLGQKEGANNLLEPHIIESLDESESIFSGSQAAHFFIVRQGKVFGMGRNECGQLGLGHKTSVVGNPSPVTFPADQKVKKIACGKRHTLFLTETGAVYSCGKNDFGQLGIGKVSENEATPMHVSAIAIAAKDISAGIDFSLVLCESGELLRNFSKKPKSNKPDFCYLLLQVVSIRSDILQTDALD
eukprot:c9107_g1_i1.p1 GENE.c9107_g1_i1~~c9107_g1_i1.p1  ORF type:complete len:212 (-),score=44.48 c9107_g1_i1:476-1081(-)